MITTLLLALLLLIVLALLPYDRPAVIDEADGEEPHLRLKPKRQR